MRNPGFVLRAAMLSMAMAGLVACDDSDDGGPDGPGGGPVVPMTPGDTFVLTSSAAGQRLLSFNRATPGSIRTAMSVTGLAGGERIVGADFRPADGNLYAVTSTSRIMRLDRATGVASAPVTLATALAGTNFGVDFNPVPDRLRVISDTGQNLRINVTDGATTVDGTLKQDRRTATTADIAGVSAAAYTMSFPQACRTTLFYLNSTSGMLMTSADPNGGTLFNVGSLGLAAPAAVNGFDVLTGTAGDGLPTNTGVAVLSSGAGAPTLHTIDLTTGAATAIGAIGVNAGEQVVSLLTPIAASPTRQARGELVALMTGATGDKLASFNRGSPAKLCTGPTAVTGLGGENIVGIDTRPATGELYAVTSGSRLMILNPDTAAATARATMSTALPTTVFSFGVDFNPVPDRLRITAANGLNLRVNPETGDTTTDTALSATDVSGAAYSNSLRSAAALAASNGGSTTLFGINNATDSLVRIGSDPASGVAADPGNPNSGVVNNVGALGVAIEGTNALEIDGLNGQALLAAFSAGSTTSQLYTVNLATGAAALVTGAAASSTVGGATGEHVRGMSLVPATAPGPAVTVFALLQNGTDLVNFLPSAAATPSAAVAITGLAGGEFLVDIDFRVTGNGQRNRQLVGLSNQNRIYVINPTTGAATGGRVLRTGAGADVIIAGTTGIDFNPVPDLLRLVSTTGQNFRINPDVDNGATADSTLSGAANDLVAVAYANNFVGTTATTLYGISAVTASLVRIGADPATGGACPGDTGNPNCGVGTLVGALGVAAPPPLGTLGDMDIVGGRNGYALAAVVPVAGGLSTLVRINLATGTATSLGTIATGGPTVRGIAVRVQ
ncbi:DUF4394 domain-containing protein [Solimonas sp. K1W22B-7]|uniref:DUF4394 domain-containing protein n=1 Tax=Solimonas sp. K1W22B-7 TaxID=2303331 RepID=UPI000E333EA2|nr:DUF4394 domain-containing protein [Solimonas sp. K1W22B-7]AXQ30324.1 DUF4394 domain-containing protein [Solimonas sp. K1W22B-7]